MRSYLAVVSLGANPVGLPTVMEAAARRGLPFRSDGAPTATWSNADGRVLIAAWSNEPEQADRPLLTRHGDGGVVGFSGSVRGPLPLPSDVTTGDLDLGGVWSVFTAHSQGLVAATCASGAEVVYVAETPELVVVGNRALLVHLTANPSGPVADLIGLAGVFNSGYCVTGRTAFDGVRALSPRERFVCELSGAASTTIYGAGGTDASAQDVAQALLASVEPLQDSEHLVRLGLTGGRDSRLLVALLTSAGVSVDTQTSGLPGDPDVVVAKEVASRLGVPHKVSRPRGAKVDEASVTVDVRARVREAVVLADGMLSAYDRVGRIDDRYNARIAPFSGSGGEILRAYFAGSLKDPHDPQEVVRYMRTRLYASAKRMAPGMLQAYQVDTAPWMTAAVDRGPAALEDFYVRQRTGRWTGSARSSASIGSLAWRPYLDHRVVTLVRNVPLEDRLSERLIADILDVLAPSLSGIRYAGRRYKFDEKPPADPALRRTWEQRAPVQGTHGDQAGLNWRTDLPEVRRELADIVMDAPSEFWDLADRKQVSEFVARTEDRTRWDTMKMWHLATVADALSSNFYVGESRFTDTKREVVAARPTATVAPQGRLDSVERAARAVARRWRDRVRR
jgi:hypothetical protein